MKAYRVKHRAKKVTHMSEPKGEHGTRQRAWNGCKCRRCVNARNAYNREYYRANRDVILARQTSRRHALTDKVTHVGAVTASHP